MSDSVDLNAYFQRLGYQGERRPTLATLAELQHRHVRRLPFENLTPFLGEEVVLDIGALERKLVGDRRGGYCYEHNLLFLDVLKQLGFQARGLAARVFWKEHPDARPPATHMLLAVDIDGETWLVDTGFGALTPTGPLKLDTEDPQTTPHEPFRVLHRGESYHLEARLGDTWRLLYSFDFREMWLADYQLASWYLSHHPRSHFVTDLVAARVGQGRRHTLLNDRYTVRYPDGTSQARVLAGPDEVLTVLEQVFRVRLPSPQALRLALEEKGVVR